VFCSEEHVSLVVERPSESDHKRDNITTTNHHPSFSRAMRGFNAKRSVHTSTKRHKRETRERERMKESKEKRRTPPCVTLKN
jgi:hypothetical protein